MANKNARPQLMTAEQAAQLATELANAVKFFLGYSSSQWRDHCQVYVEACRIRRLSFNRSLRAYRIFLRVSYCAVVDDRNRIPIFVRDKVENFMRQRGLSLVTDIQYVKTVGESYVTS